jgi:hypothetical protein
MSGESETSDLLWFSQLVNEYDVTQSGRTKTFVTIGRLIKLDWDNCRISPTGIDSKGKVKFVIRSKTNRNSDYMGHIPVQLRFMLEIEIEPTRISEPTIERQYSVSASQRRHLPQSVKQLVHDRWVIRLGDKAEVWEWTQAGMDIRLSRVYALYQNIQKFLDGAHPVSNILDGKLRIPEDKLEDIVPVVYQPAVDSLNNFLREMHCMKITNSDGSADVEVSLLFNNEQLRKFKLADGIYRWLRKLLYGRSIDVETFKIHFVKDDLTSNYFLFEGIYSGDYDLEYDTIHEDKPPAPMREVRYYFDDHYHPIVFVNTSNHAMAPHDNNHELWKWEYVSWLKGAPIIFGTKSRKEIERSYKSILGIFG